MIDADHLPERPGSSVEADEWAFHHRVFYRLVLGAAGIHTEDLQRLYDALGIVLYQGTLDTPIASRRHRRKYLHDLRDAGMITTHETSRGWMWVPAEDVVDGDHSAQKAREAQRADVE